MSERRAAVIDLASGAVDDLLGANPAQSFDAVLSGDGAAVIISSCADLDPAVGNPDRNNELFRFDLVTRQAVQITDTRGGKSNCELLDGMAYDPLVSHDAGVVTFAAPADTTTGRQHSLRNDFAFGPVRAVSVIAGNTAPRYELIGATTRLVGEQFELGVRSGDRDLDPITFFAEMGEGGLPEGASFTLDRNDPQAGFYWQTGAQSIGEHILRLGIFDGRGGENIQYVRLTICRLYVRADDPLLVTSAIFDAPPASCGDADANGDAAITAADLVASRRRRI